MYKKSPVWSISGKRNQFFKRDNHTQKNIVPSPFHYNPKLHNSKNLSCKIGKQKRNHLKMTAKPGPTTYNISQQHKSTKFGKFGKEQRLKKRTQKTPNPFSYSPSSGVKFTKNEHNFAPFEFPGPGEYEIKSTDLALTKSGLKFSRNRRFNQNHTEGPSPVEYSPEKLYHKTSISFPKQPKQAKLCSNSTTPGPADYTYSGFFTRSGSQKGYSIASKHSAKKQNDNPGPGAYNQPIKFAQSPQKSFGLKLRQPKISLTPGPHEYHCETTKKNEGISIGKQNRVPNDHKSITPGPGDYQSHRQYRKSPNYSISSNFYQVKQLEIPGPGTYSPDGNMLKFRPRSVKIGRSKRDTVQKDKSPGPGDYEPKLSRPSSAKVPFGKAQRMKIKNEVTPGPGDYESQTIFSSLHGLPRK